MDNSQRTWPVPTRPWIVGMTWSDLAFLHWPVAHEVLRPFIPEALQLDSYDGQAWLGIVPFSMEVRPRLLPRIPSFPEINVRTYVTYEGKPGVWFFSLDTTSALTVKVGRKFFDVPYFEAELKATTIDGRIRYEARRAHRGAPPARFAASYAPTGEIFRAREHSLEYFLAERYCLYSENPKKRLFRTEVAHDPWPLQLADCRIEASSLTERLGVSTFNQKPHAMFSRRIDVISWSRERVL